MRQLTQLALDLRALSTNKESIEVSFSHTSNQNLKMILATVYDVAFLIIEFNYTFPIYDS